VLSDLSGSERQLSYKLRERVMRRAGAPQGATDTNYDRSAVVSIVGRSGRSKGCLAAVSEKLGWSSACWVTPPRSLAIWSPTGRAVGRSRSLRSHARREGDRRTARPIASQSSLPMLSAARRKRQIVADRLSVLAGRAQLQQRPHRFSASGPIGRRRRLVIIRRSGRMALYWVHPL
jgi:hypothetical protein